VNKNEDEYPPTSGMEKINSKRNEKKTLRRGFTSTQFKGLYKTLV
jgi:hypothetical protein